MEGRFGLIPVFKLTIVVLQEHPLTDNPPVSPEANDMRHLNYPEYHCQHREDSISLLDAVAEPKVIE